MNQKEFVSIKEFAKLSGLGIECTRQRVLAGTLPFIFAGAHGGKRMIPAQAAMEQLRKEAGVSAIGG